MSAPNNLRIATLLGLAPPPEGLLAWHHAICGEGFPAQAVKVLAGYVGVTVKDLSAAVGVTPANKKNLNAEASNTLYRIAVVWNELQALFPTSPKDASNWLTAARPTLRGRIPLQLLTSSIGYDYVRAAIERELGTR